MRRVSRLLRDRNRALGFWQGMTLERPRIGDSGVVRVHGFGTSASLGHQARGQVLRLNGTWQARHKKPSGSQIAWVGLPGLLQTLGYKLDFH